MRIFATLCCLLSFNIQAKTLPIIDYAKFDQWQEVQISPTGKYLSAMTYLDGKKVIVMFDAKTLQPINKVNFRGRAQPGQTYWVGEDRIVTQKMYLRGYNDFPVTYNEYFAVNADGSKSRYVFGYKTGHVSKDRALWGEVLDPLPDDNDYMLMVGTPMSKVFDIRPSVYKVNVHRKGKMKKVIASPLKRAVFLTDEHKQVRFVTGFNEEKNLVTQLYKDGKWLSTEDLNIANESFDPVSYKSNSDEVYALYSENGGPTGLYLFDLTTGKKEVVFQHDVVSIDYDSIKTDSKGNVYAVGFDDGYPATVFVDADNSEAKILKELMQTLQGYNVDIVSQTLDGNDKIIFASNQFNPGDYLLYKVKQKQLVHLFSKRPWLDSTRTTSTVPFKFKTRDNLELLTYVTLPPGIDTLQQAKNLPFVVKVHGGPHGVRDYMRYDSEDQLYASRGIAVLRVNFRGSGGFGYNFTEKGYEHWGDKVQYDIIDSINTLVQYGVADKNRLCIMGYSFGGYSALQSSVIAPEQFKCAIGISGIYDLTLLSEIGDIASNKISSANMSLYVGEDEQALKAASPVYNLQPLKADILIIHGGRDKRAPIRHAENLIKAMKKQGKSYQWMELEDDAHQIYEPKNREKVFKRTLSFLQKHLLSK